MSRRSRSTKPKRTLAVPPSPPVARAAGSVLRSSTVGALPILDHLLRRMRLEEFLRAYLPAEDRRTKLAATKALLVLLRNLLVSREPIYGVGEWAARYAPDLLGVTEKEIALLNDDRVGRGLDRLFLADVSSLVLAGVERGLARHPDRPRPATGGLRRRRLSPFHGRRPRVTARSGFARA
jgi:hypothetical protein